MTSGSPSQIQKLPRKQQQHISQLSEHTKETTEELISAIEASGLEEFMEYIRSPWRMLWPNFIAGVARGVGALLGATLVIACIGWTLSLIIDLPLIGKRLEPYVAEVQGEFRKYAESTNYKSNFANMETRLIEIRDELRKHR